MSGNKNRVLRCDYMTESNYVKFIPISEGYKIWPPNKETCLQMEKKLNSVGVQTRVGCACGTDIWSIYIISVPDNLINTEVEL